MDEIILDPPGVNCDYLVSLTFVLDYIIANIFNFLGIINSTEESLFTYNEDESWSTFYQPDFIPFFEPTFSSSVLEQQANAICGNDIFCQYSDTLRTGTHAIMIFIAGSPPTVQLSPRSTNFTPKIQCIRDNPLSLSMIHPVADLLNGDSGAAN